MSAKRKYFISYLLIFIICGVAYGVIHYLFKSFASEQSEDALSEALLSGVFFGILMVAIILIAKPKKRK